MDDVQKKYLIENRLFTEEQVCGLLNVEHKTMISWRSRGNMPTPAGKAGRRYFYHWDDIHEMITGGVEVAEADRQTIADVLGANLDRIQIIKGWVDKYGDTNEKIVDVVWSGDRQINSETGKLSPVGNTVDLDTAKYTNDIGAATLIGSWTDDGFDPQEAAYYYARALEIPTPRWSTYDTVRAGLPLLEDVPATIQERAWGSPIWYKIGN